MTALTCIGKLLKKAGIDGFLTLLIAVVALAWLFPAVGAAEGAFTLARAANAGISFIFFFYGLGLNRAKLSADIGNWRLHILIHGSTFVIFPLLILTIRPLFQSSDSILLWTGIFYLAALPSTVSSSVVMVSIAGGNVPAAIFNASISSLLGVFVTPLWMSAAVSVISGTDFADFGSIIWKLSLQILFPVALGVLFNRRWGKFSEKYRRPLRMFDQSVILLIVYTSFSASFSRHLFDGFSWMATAGCIVGMLTLFLVVFGFVKMACRLLKMNREDAITAQFCGSKKSLVHGTAMSKVIFSDYGSVGVILLPVMLYHALQLIVVSAIARKMSRHTGVSLQ